MFHCSWWCPVCFSAAEVLLSFLRLPRVTSRSFDSPSSSHTPPLLHSVPGSGSRSTSALSHPPSIILLFLSSSLLLFFLPLLFSHLLLPPPSRRPRNSSLFRRPGRQHPHRIGRSPGLYLQRRWGLGARRYRQQHLPDGVGSHQVRPARVLADPFAQGTLRVCVGSMHDW